MREGEAARAALPNFGRNFCYTDHRLTPTPHHHQPLLRACMVPVCTCVCGSSIRSPLLSLVTPPLLLFAGVYTRLKVSGYTAGIGERYSTWYNRWYSVWYSSRGVSYTLRSNERSRLYPSNVSISVADFSNKRIDSARSVTTNSSPARHCFCR